MVCEHYYFIICVEQKRKRALAWNKAVRMKQVPTICFNHATIVRVIRGTHTHTHTYTKADSQMGKYAMHLNIYHHHLAVKCWLFFPSHSVRSHSYSHSHSLAVTEQKLMFFAVCAGRAHAWNKWHPVVCFFAPFILFIKNISQSPVDEQINFCIWIQLESLKFECILPPFSSLFMPNILWRANVIERISEPVDTEMWYPQFTLLNYYLFCERYLMIHTNNNSISFIFLIFFHWSTGDRHFADLFMYFTNDRIPIRQNSSNRWVFFIHFWCSESDTRLIFVISFALSRNINKIATFCKKKKI